MSRNILETIAGAIVLIVAGFFLYTATKSSSLDTDSGYPILARFDRVDGLLIGSDVRVSGIKVGTVAAQKLDEETYQAVVTFDISESVKIPKDSSAEIVGDGLLGGKYIAIVPGAEEEMLTENEEIRYTQSSVSIEALIGKMIYSGDEKTPE